MPLGLLTLLASLIAFAPLAIDMYLPALPQIAHELGAPEAAVQGTLAAYLGGMAVGQLVYGQLSGRLGRRVPLLIGLGLFVLASLGCAQADSVQALTLWRVLQALGGCAAVVMPLTIVADRVQGDAEMARVMSRLMGVIGLAPIVAPALGNAVMAWIGWRGIFVMLAGLATVAAAVVAWRLEETWPQARRQAAAAQGRQGGPLRAWGQLLRDRRFACAALAGPLASAGMFAYIGASAFVLIEHHGLSAGQFSLVFAGNALLMTLVSQVNAVWVRHWAPQRVLRLALAGLGGVGLGLVLLGALAPGALLPLLGGLALYLGLLGLVSANASALALAGHPPERRGLASGLMGTLQFAGGAVVGGLMGAAGQIGPLSLGVSMAGCALLAWAVMQLRPR